MSVFKGSRYGSRSGMIGINENNEVKRLLYRINTLSDNDLEQFVVHVVRLGDRVDTLAQTYGGDARKWWVICEVNELTDYPFDLVPGQELKIPVKLTLITSSQASYDIFRNVPSLIIPAQLINTSILPVSSIISEKIFTTSLKFVTSRYTIFVFTPDFFNSSCNDSAFFLFK